MAKTKFMAASTIQRRLDKLDEAQHQLQALREKQPVLIVEFLTALGNTDRKIAASLRKLGIKALKGHNHKCALAIALRDEFGQPTTVGGAHAITVDGFKVRAGKNYEAVSTFIRNFDSGKYPSLVR